MKPYIVIRYDVNQLYDVGVPRMVTAATGRAYTQDNYKNNEGSNFGSFCYFTDTIHDAEVLADSMIKAAPQYSYLIAKTSDLFTVKKIDVQRASVSEKGVLPL